MVERYRPNANVPQEPPAPENRFLARKELTYLHTGCTLLDCVIGGPVTGGWPFGRAVNIVGDKSTGKTLLAEEAMMNFIIAYKRKPHYRESESAFDPSYFAALGGNPDMVDFGPDGPETHWQTIEQIIDDIRKLLDKFDAEVATKVALLKKKASNRRKKPSQLQAEARKQMPPSLYIIDSLDSLSAETELGRDIHEGSYNLAKQKLFGELFRTEVGRIKRAKMCLMIISQTRDRIGPMIRGKTYRRHCDKVLDFYCSAVLYLSDLGKVYETHKKVKRAVAIKVRAKADKNKIVAPFRECVFELRFGYGIDDDWACLDYLKMAGRLQDIGLRELPKDADDVDKDRLVKATKQVWLDIEKAFTPAKGKYAA